MVLGSNNAEESAAQVRQPAVNAGRQARGSKPKLGLAATPQQVEGNISQTCCARVAAARGGVGEGV